MIHIDTPIGRDAGEFSSNDFRAQMPPTFEPLTIRIHSEGGSCFEAFAICDLIQGHNGPTKAIVSAAAFSAASLIAAVCDSCEVTGNGYFMVHSPHIETEALSDSQASLLESLETRMVALYQEKTGQPEGLIRRMMHDETFLDAEAAYRFGLADRILERASFAEVAIPVARLRSTPLPKSIKRVQAAAKWTAAVDAAKATGLTRSQAIAAVDKSHPGLRLQYIAEHNQR